MQVAESRGQWSSRLGFILAAAGSAVGLGNIWRFPYVTGENGGAAFVVVYLGCVFLIGLPLLWNELAIGRASGKDAIGAFLALKKGTPFVITGVFCLLCCFLVLGYYSVIAGWTIGYAMTEAVGVKLEFEKFASDPTWVIPLFALFMLMTVLIVQGGVQKGIERWAKVLMPLLFLIVLVVIVRSVTLPGALAGIEYYLKPDFGKINGRVIITALGQAFFSLSVGWGLMITYGSYLEKHANIVTCGVWVVVADTLVALLGGFMVFPAVFAFGMQPDAGTALTFKTLPAVFSQMPGGAFFGCLFFLLLMVAALTSSISMLEVPVAYLVDEKGWSRRAAAWTVGLAAFVVGLPSALAAGASQWLSSISLFGKTGFMDIMDLLVGTMLIVVIALLCSVFTGYVWGTRKAVEEISSGCESFNRPLIGGLSLGRIWAVFVSVICPLVIGLVLANMIAELFGKDLF
ncbi:MAG: sodium-dependent transporter [Verrucomicrobia bacterium]|nr:MAG: sodium-dependent transporter [Verrucomicrobiota bacterium]